jgi:hypothetical protein
MGQDRGDNGVTGLVISDTALLFFIEGQAPAFQSEQNLVARFFDILHADFTVILMRGQQSGFLEQIFKIGAAEARGSPGQALDVNVVRQGFVPGVDPEYGQTPPRRGQRHHLAPLVFQTLISFSGKLIVLALACLLFSRYFEKPITQFFVSRGKPPDPMLAVVGIGLIFAAMAGQLGFSLAIGAFFVGLVFSRDPEAVKMEASFQPVYELFSPFFFIGIGLDIDPAGLKKAILPGLVLLVAAVAGKLAANGIPLLITDGAPAAVLVAVSMIPRSEIALVVLSRGRALGDWAIPDDIYSAVVMVCAATSLLPPIVVRFLLKKWPPE